jgi:hypothetical protein
MLNKINTLLASTSTTVIKEFKTTLYSFSNPSTGTTFTLPAGITDGSLGFFLIGLTKTAGSTPILLGTPTGFTLINKVESVNAGTGKSGTNGLFYKYMTASDSGSVVSGTFADSLAVTSEAVFVEVILNKNAQTKGFGSLTNGSASASGGAVTLTDVPSVIPNNSPFFILICSTSSDGGITDTFSGGMELYDTSLTNLNNTSRTTTKLFQYNDLRIQDLPDTADFIHTSTVTGYGSQGDYIIWLK